MITSETSDDLKVLMTIISVIPDDIEIQVMITSDISDNADTDDNNLNDI